MALSHQLTRLSARLLTTYAHVGPLLSIIQENTNFRPGKRRFTDQYYFENITFLSVKCLFIIFVLDQFTLNLLR